MARLVSYLGRTLEGISSSVINYTLDDFKQEYEVQDTPVPSIITVPGRGCVFSLGATDQLWYFVVVSESADLGKELSDSLGAQARRHKFRIRWLGPEPVQF